MRKIARPSGNRPPEFDGIYMLGRDLPHHGYPLRNIGKERFPITMRRADEKIGEVKRAYKRLQTVYSRDAHCARPFNAAKNHNLG